MGARDYWDRMLVYFGITDEMASEESKEHAPARARRSSSERDEWSEPAPTARRSSSQRRSSSSAAPSHAASYSGPAGVSVVPPRTFNDAQAIADHFKRGVPVIVNLQSTEADLAKRLIDFASGLTYGLDGAMQRIADKVFLLTPPNVEVSAEERAAMLENEFFNQS